MNIIIFNKFNQFIRLTETSAADGAPVYADVSEPYHNKTCLKTSQEGTYF